MSQEDEQEIHIVLVSDDPERAYPALTLLLAGKAALDVDAHLYCTMSGLKLVRKDTVRSITMEGMPPAEKFLRDATDAGAKVYVCVPSKEMLEKMGVKRENLIDGVKIEEAVAFLERALSASKRGGIVLFV